MASGTTLLMIVLFSVLILVGSSLLAMYFGRHTKTSEDWAVGGRKLPLYVIVGTQYATAMGGGVLVAHIGIAYANGWSLFIYGGLVSGGFILLALLAKWLRANNFTTIPDIFEHLYGDNKLLALLAAFMSFSVPFGGACAQMIAFAKLYNAITGIPINYLIIVFAVVAALLVLPAGLTSVAWTDFLMGCFMIVISVISGAYALNMAGGWSNIVATVPAEIIKFPQGLLSVGMYSIGLWALSILPGTLTAQTYYQRIFAVKEPKDAAVSLIISAFVIFTAEIWATVMGFSIRTANGGLAPELASGWFLTQIPAWFLVIFAGFIVSVLVTTVDSNLQSACVTFSRDIYQKILKPDATDAQVLKASRATTIVITVLCIIMGTSLPSVLGWTVATFAYSAAGLLVPIFGGYFLRNKKFTTPTGAICSVLFGFLGCGFAHLVNTSIPYVGYGLVGSLIGMILGSLLTRKQYYADQH